MINIPVTKYIAEILVVSSFPPRVCGIATYTQDLIRAVQNKFSSSFSIRICALETDETNRLYSTDVKYILKTSLADDYEKIAASINLDHNIKIVLIQHEFDFFKGHEQAFLEFIYLISKPVIVSFHTVLPDPDELTLLNVRHIAAACTSVIVMTNSCALILDESFGIPKEKINIIPPGTHLVPILLKGPGIRLTIGQRVNRLFQDEPLRKNLDLNTMQKTVSTSWQNSAIAHAMLIQKTGGDKINLLYDLPAINLDHLKHMTTQTGILQYSKINQPDPGSGYTLDDNARALIAMCLHYKITEDDSDLYYIERYLHFIKHCLQPDGTYLNYLDQDNRFTGQNSQVNLDDATGRAVWALGYLVSLMGLAPWEIISEAITLFKKSLVRINEVYSARAMAFIIKGLYLYRQAVNSPSNLVLVNTFANRLAGMYKKETSENWSWFEGKMTYANSVLPESMLYAWLLTSDKLYKDIALSSFDFLLSRTFNSTAIKMISGKKPLMKDQEPEPDSSGSEQPYDVACTIMTLNKFYNVFGDKEYKSKMENAFSWFLGNNRLGQIVYNPCTGGCYDGLEEFHVNLNQGASSTLSYLVARLTIESSRIKENPVKKHVYMSTLALKS